MVWNTDLKSTPKFVLLRLADFAADDGGKVFPGVKRVARDTGLCLRAVRDAYRVLEDCGVLVMVAAEDPANHLPREYRIDLDRLRELAVASSPTADELDIPTTPPPAPDAVPPGISCLPPRHQMPHPRHQMPYPPAPDAANPS
ncbi:helix-turn-helix domain-containing protein [Azospirillum sp. TSH58]|uniref:helix-turn-helix domain-containing protein n=1 Tax=Azospirillum sp. TSH58 TaxID=664962 RepID=UPI00352F3162